jgi:hypothetical protein
VAARWRMGPAVVRTCRTPTQVCVPRDLDRIHVTVFGNGNCHAICLHGQNDCALRIAMRFARDVVHENTHCAFSYVDN